MNRAREAEVRGQARLDVIAEVWVVSCMIYLNSARNVSIIANGKIQGKSAFPNSMYTMAAEVIFQYRTVERLPEAQRKTYLSTPHSPQLLFAQPAGRMLKSETMDSPLCSFGGNKINQEQGGLKHTTPS